jgi:circadian clock protein KaiC
MSSIARLSSGIEGLDAVLNGGFIEGRSYLLDGPPGAGKTIFGLHFLEAGIEAGETALFINLEEDIDDLRTNAEALGFSTDGIEFLDLSPGADVFVEDRTYDVFEPTEVEQEPLTEQIVDRVEAVDPDRVMVDPVTQLRYLTSGEYQFRKQIVGFMRFLKGQGATTLFSAQDTEELPTDQLEFISDGTISLGSGPAGREVRVSKFRGSETLSGRHTFRIRSVGVTVYPELQPTESINFERGTVSSGVPEVDELLSGGFERGTVSIISGPTGVGKTTLGSQFMKEAAGRGERSVIYLFEESKRTFLERSTAVNIPVEKMIERGTLRVEEIDALDQSPQEFANEVKREVETEDTAIVMIDGLAGYRLTLRGSDEQMLGHVHRLGRYLKSRGVTTLLIDETSSVTGSFQATEEHVSYIADNIVFLRHLELGGELQKAVGVLKKRTSDFERTLRQYEITGHGIKVGEPLTNVRGILTGTPELVGDRSGDVDSAGD